MRYAAKRDSNETPIIAYLRRCSISVEQINARKIPDLLVGYRGNNLLFEVKGKTGKLTTDQVEFFKSWQGQKAIVRTIDDVKRELRKMHYPIGTKVYMKEPFNYYALVEGRYKCKELFTGQQGEVVALLPNHFAPSTFVEVQFPNDGRISVPEKMLGVVNG